jgi:ATP-dependent Lhr-like helicase
VLEREILRARVVDYQPSDLDALVAAGEILWCGIEPLGERDGKVALYLTEHFERLWTPKSAELDDAEQRALCFLREQGASFFAAIHHALGDGYPATTTDLLWGLVWKGLVTNDTFRALRAHVEPRAERKSRRSNPTGFRSRRQAPRAGEGRWSLLEARVQHPPSATERTAAWVELLLQRHGVVTREVATAEGIAGGFSALYDVFKALEESGKVRRGYFVAGVGALQFALPGVLERLRALRTPPDCPEVVQLAATDPANPYGSLLKWPVAEGRSPARSAQALVILIDGALAAYFTRGGKQLQVFLPEAEPDRTRVGEALARRLKRLASAPDRGGLLLAEINGQAAERHPLGSWLQAAGFLPSAQGYFLPKHARDPLHQPDAPEPPVSHDR